MMARVRVRDEKAEPGAHDRGPKSVWVELDIDWI